MEHRADKPTPQIAISDALQGAQAGVWEWWIASDLLTWSPEMGELTGISAEVPPTREMFFEHVHPDDRAKLYLATVNAVDVSSEMYVELRLMHPQGIRWISIRAQVMREDGKPIRLVGLSQDISDRRRAEARYAQLTDLVPCIVWSTAPDGRTLFMNPRWEEVTGESFDFETDASWESVTHPDDYPRARARWRRSLSSGEPYETEVRYRVPVGGYRWYLERAEPVHDDQMQVTEWFGTSVDVHDQKTKEEALAFLLQLTESSREDPDPESIMATTMRMLAEHMAVARCGYAEVEPNTETFAVYDEWAPNLRSLRGIYALSNFGEYVASHMREGRNLVIRNTASEIPADEGGDALRAFSMEAMIVSPLLKEGKLTGMLGVFSDYPRTWSEDEVGLVKMAAERSRAFIERARSERALRELNAALERRVEERTRELVDANREMEGFTYTVSHDLRAPLRAISSTSMMLLADAGDKLNDEEKALLQRQAHNAKRLGILIDELLKLSRLSREEVHSVRFDLSALAHDVSEELVADGRASHIRFEISPHLRAEGDPRLIRFVMLNLLENACKFSPPSPCKTPTIRVGQRGDEYFVTDEGIGFDPRYSERLFRPFERLVNDEEYPGTGIGLANVKRIVERHGGTARAESRPGQGATFYFSLKGRRTSK